MIKVPKFKEIQLEFTASKVNHEVKIYLPYYTFKKDRFTSSFVPKGNYILTDQFDRQWQISERDFKNNFEQSN